MFFYACFHVDLKVVMKYYYFSNFKTLELYISVILSCKTDNFKIVLYIFKLFLNYVYGIYSIISRYQRIRYYLKSKYVRNIGLARDTEPKYEQ